MLESDIEKLHTTELGALRIKKNLALETDDVVEWCKRKICGADEIIRQGKNWYAYNGDVVITVNALSKTIITAHVRKELRSKPGIRYIDGNEELLDRIAPLWAELNAIHHAKSVHFKAHYAGFTFEARKNTLLKAAEKGCLRVLLAYDNELPVGYCVASVIDGLGEVDSLFVSETYRKKGIASSLMERALDWIDTNGAVKIALKVSVGNEAVLGFYARYGFLPRLIELQRVSDT